MRKMLLILVFAGLVSSCQKKITTTTVSDAVYAVTITGKWQTPQFTIPPNVHFTFFAGMLHNSSVKLWAPGFNASLGIENVAEVGGINELIQEVDVFILQRNAMAHIAIPQPSATGSITSNIYLNEKYPLVSFASMIAPSPDWFIGLNGFSLYNGGVWASDTTVNLYVYDAGTEEGDVFSLSNAATVPQQPITLLTPAKATVLANGNAVLAPIATVRFKKL